MSAVNVENQSVKLLLKIFQNILSYPFDPRYRDLNHEKIKRKFTECKPCFYLLFCAGFQQVIDDTKTRLKWYKTDQNMNLLKKVNNAVKCYINISALSNQDVNISNNHENNSHLLRSTKIAFNNYGYHCDLSECLSLTIVCDVLLFYNEKINNSDEKVSDNQLNFNDIFSQIGNKYKTFNFLNDFIHLLSHHSNQFDDIYDILQDRVYANTNSCNLLRCLFMTRNQRDRHQSEKNTKYHPGQQLLDRIHCYYFHSYDTGFKLSKQEKISVNVLNEERKSNSIDMLRVSEIVRSKRKNYTNISHFNRLNCSSNKFKLAKKDVDSKQYDYGIRFYYWDYCKNDHSQWLNQVRCTSIVQETENWFVANKYKDLKTELTNNAIYVVTQQQFNELETNAQMHLNSDKVKDMRCLRKTSARCYDMQYQQLMSKEHLISMMVYCNYDEVQRKFSETFRRFRNESNESVKNRHRNYYFFAKLLRECVECFGMSYDPLKQENIRVFHGASQSFSFSSMDSCIMGPFSTTTDYWVAVNFADIQGTILEMHIPCSCWVISANEGLDSGMFKLTCMDMSWISNYINEQEIFCIGGLNRIYHKTVIDIVSGVDYRLYMSGLTTLARNLGVEKSNAIDAFRMFNPSSTEILMACRLLCHEMYQNEITRNHSNAQNFKSCPSYIENILHSQCTNVWKIQMEPTNKILSYFFTDKAIAWMKLDLMTAVFPKLSYIHYEDFTKNVEWLTGEAIYESTLGFLATDTKSMLNEIIILFHVKYTRAVRQYIGKYKDRFSRFSWSIDVIVQNMADHIDLSHHSNTLQQIGNNGLQQMMQDPDISRHAQASGNESLFKDIMMNPQFIFAYIQMKKFNGR
eukprot:371932_1